MFQQSHFLVFWANFALAPNVTVDEMLFLFILLSKLLDKKQREINLSDKAHVNQLPLSRLWSAAVHEPSHVSSAISSNQPDLYL